MKTVVLSLGGSILVQEKINVDFLKAFKQFIEKHISQGYRFIIIVGGGRTCREYQNAAKDVAMVHPEDLDWLGIHATRLNAHLIRTIFKDYSNPVVVKDPTKKKDFNENILVAAGWKPGWSTDYDAVLLAKNYGVKTIINMTNTDYVCDKDPNKNADARPLKDISWSNFRKLVGNEWKPGLNMPFDPVASKLASELKLKVIIVCGTDIENLGNILSGKDFKGTTIS
jgi:uridylate kinase